MALKILLIILNIIFPSILCSIIITTTTTTNLPNAKILNDGNIMPILSLGTFTKKDNHDKIEKAVMWALEAGYRHIDTSPTYEVEDLVGNAVINATEQGIITRNDLFITTKIADSVNSTEAVVPALKESLRRLRTNYVDLLLIHYPYDVTGDKKYNILEIWRGLEEAQKLELTRSIGVSNFNSSHINKLLTYTNVRPAVNQIEINPTFTELELTAYCQSQGITLMAYGPLGFMVDRPFNELSIPPHIDEPVLLNIAKKYEKTTLQVVLRYLIDRGVVPIPQSTNKEHIEQNIDVFDFSLTSEDIYIINEFNRNEKVYNYGVESNAAISKYFYGTVYSDY